VSLITVIHVLIYFVSGALIGTGAGLLGIGGGLIAVPLLAFLFPYEGVPSDIVMHMAVGTTLCITIFTSLSSIRAHLHQGGVLTDVAKRMFVGLALGAIIGAAIADLLPSRVLQIIFGVFALVIAFKMGLNLKPKVQHCLPGKLGLFVVSLCLSVLCSLLGLAGGTVTVPFFNRCNVPMDNAVATSAVCTLPIAAAGGVSYLIAGLNETGLPHFSIGYVFLPALIGVASMSVLFAPIGAKLAHRLPAVTLKRIFAVFLVMVGLDMLLF